jgi:hypothetical protein
MASIDHLAVPSGSGVAIRFTVPALRVTRMYCSVDATSERSQPINVSLYKPDGTWLAKARDECLEDSLPGHSTECTRTMFCNPPINAASDYVLVIESASRAPTTTVSAGVTAMDPHE